MKRCVAALIVASFLIGCRQSVDLGAVRAMAAAASDARPTYNAVAADYYDSCLRTAELHSISSSVMQKFAATTLVEPRHHYAPGRRPGDLRRAPLTTIVAITAAEIATFDREQTLAIVLRPDRVAIDAGFDASRRTALATAATTTGTAGDVLSCFDARDVAQQWRKRNDVLLGYFVALGTLAGSSATDDRYGIAALSKSLENDGAFANDAQTKAFDSLASGIATKIFAAERRDELATNVRAGVPLIEQMIAQLSAVASVNYKFELEQERDTLDQFRSENLHAAGRGVEAFQVYEYAKSMRDDESDLDAREVAADAYVASLHGLEHANAEIVTALERNDLVAAAAVARAYADDLQGDLRLMGRVTNPKGKE